MSRPKSGRKGSNVTLYIETTTLKAAKRYAFFRNTSLSDLVNRLLVAEMRSEEGIADQFPRQFTARKNATILTPIAKV